MSYCNVCGFERCVCLVTARAPVRVRGGRRGWHDKDVGPAKPKRRPPSLLSRALAAWRKLGAFERRETIRNLGCVDSSKCDCPPSIAARILRELGKKPRR